MKKLALLLFMFLPAYCFGGTTDYFDLSHYVVVPDTTNNTNAFHFRGNFFLYDDTSTFALQNATPKVTFFATGTVRAITLEFVNAIFHSTSTVFDNEIIFSSFTVFGSSVVFNSTTTFNSFSTFNSTVTFSSTTVFDASVTFIDPVMFSSYTVFNSSVTFSSTTVFNSTATFTSNIVLPALSRLHFGADGNEYLSQVGGGQISVFLGGNEVYTFDQDRFEPLSDGQKNLGNSTARDWNVIYYHQLSQDSGRQGKDNITPVDPITLKADRLPSPQIYERKLTPGVTEYGLIADDMPAELIKYDIDNKPMIQTNALISYICGILKEFEKRISQLEP